MMKQSSLLLLLIATSVASAEVPTNLRSSTHTHQHRHQRRELSNNSWWSTLLAALHCPPIGPKHHQCMARHQSGGSGSGSGNNSGTAASYNGNDDASSWSYNDDVPSNTASSYNDDASRNSNGNGGNGGGSNNDDAASSDDGNVYIQADDDWSADGWDSNELGNGQEYRGTSAGAGAGGNVGNIIGYIVGALVAGCVGAALVISRKRRQQQEENHPLEGSLKKRMKLFSGGVFHNKRNRSGKNAPLTDDEASEAPSFIEIASIRSGADDDTSVRSGTSRSYRAPRARESAIFENESGESEL